MILFRAFIIIDTKSFLGSKSYLFYYKCIEINSRCLKKSE